MKVFDLIKTRYTDFNDSVKAYLSKTLTNYDENYGNNTIFGQLINVLGSTVQNMLLYVEDALTEQNKYTAQRKKSIYSLAQLSGYNPSLGKAATCNLRLMFQPNNEHAISIVLKNKTPLICSYNGLKYNVVLPQEAILLSLDRDNTNKFIQVVEGTYESQTFSSQGGQLYTQTVLLNGDIDIDYLEVKINDEVWERCDSIYDMNPDGKQYVVKTSLNKGIDIIFGNDQYGRSLEVNDIIKVTYLVHNGELGNIDTQQNCYFSFQDEIEDSTGTHVNANEMLVIKLADTNTINGGTYAETTAKVQQMIGYNSRALVLADPKNYKVFLNRFSFVGYNRTWADEGSLIVNSIVLKNYKQMLNTGLDYFNLKESDLLLSDIQKSSIETAISNSGQQLAGVTHKIFDPEICKYAIYMYVKMKNTIYDKNATETAIRTSLGEFMTDLDDSTFIAKSAMINKIQDDVDNIQSLDLYILSEKNEKAIQEKQYTKNTYSFNPSKGTYDIKTETIYLGDGENPGLGLDEYDNIYLDNNDQFPVLMGGWDFISSATNLETQTTTITDPVIITFR